MKANPVITIAKKYASVSDVVYCMELHQLITIRKPFQLLITVNDGLPGDPGKVWTMTMPQAITIPSTGKKFLDFAAFH